MTASTSDRPLTADEFLDLPRPELTRRELIDGELVVVHGPGLDHQLAVGALYYRLQQWCHGGTGRGFLVLDGDTGLNDRTVLRPDLQWFAAGRDIRAEERRSLPLGDLVVEVRSPSTWSRDIGIKRRLYEQHGAREYWLVDLIARSVIRLHRDTDATGLDDGVELTEDESLTTPLLPGFALPVADVFADPTADTT